MSDELIGREATIAAIASCLDSHSERWSLGDTCNKACSCHSIIAALRSLPAFEPDVEKAAEALCDEASAIRWMHAGPKLKESLRRKVLAILRAAGVPPAALDGPGEGE